MRKKAIISIIFPVYNEEKRVLSSLQMVHSYLKQKNYHFELIIVNDGSTDATQKILDEFTRGKRETRTIHLSINKGKGRAIRSGVRECKGEYIFFSDIDLSVPISLLSKFMVELKDHHIAIASRRAPGSLIRKRQHSLRQMLGHGFTILSSYLLGLEVSDVTCGFKGFTKQEAKLIFSEARINRWAFDAEILYLARRHNFSIVEIPVVWENREGTKVKIVRDLAQSLMELLSIPFKHLQN